MIYQKVVLSTLWPFFVMTVFHNVCLIKKKDNHVAKIAKEVMPGNTKKSEQRPSRQRLLAHPLVSRYLSYSTMLSDHCSHVCLCLLFETRMSDGLYGWRHDNGLAE